MGKLIGVVKKEDKAQPTGKVIGYATPDPDYLNQLAMEESMKGFEFNSLKTFAQQQQYKRENPNVSALMGGAQYNPIPHKNPTILTSEGYKQLATAQAWDKAQRDVVDKNKLGAKSNMEYIVSAAMTEAERKALQSAKQKYKNSLYWERMSGSNSNDAPKESESKLDNIIKNIDRSKNLSAVLKDKKSTQEIQVPDLGGEYSSDEIKAIDKYADLYAQYTGMSEKEDEKSTLARLVGDLNNNANYQKSLNQKIAADKERNTYFNFGDMTEHPREKVARAGKNLLNDILMTPYDDISFRNAERNNDLKYLTPEELQMYYRKKDISPAEGDAFFKSAIPVIEARKVQSTIEWAQKFGHEHTWIGTGLSFITNIGSAPEQLGNMIRYAETGTMGYNTSALVTSGIRGAVSEKTDWKIKNWDAFDFVYNTVSSGVDSALNAALFGPAAPYMLGLSAAANQSNDILQRGGTSEQAFWGGLASGAFEMIFEKWTIGNIKALKEIPASSAKTFFKNMAKSMLTNASEETLTEIANVAYDTFLNADISQYKMLVEQYMQENISPEEAEKKAQKALIQQIIEAGLSGALMGFGFTAAYGSKGLVNANKNSYNQIGGNVRTQKLTNTVFSMAENLDESSASRKYAQTLSEDGNYTDVDLGRLTVMVVDEMRQTAFVEVEGAIYDRLLDVGQTSQDASKNAKSMAALLANMGISQEQKTQLLETVAPSEVYSELVAENSPEWVQNLNDNLKEYVGKLSKLSSAFDSVETQAAREILQSTANGGIIENRGEDDDYDDDMRGDKERVGGKKEETSRNIYSGTESENERSWRNTQEEFSRRKRKEAQIKGTTDRLKIITSKSGKSVCSYISKSADGSEAYRAVEILKSRGYDVDYSDGTIEDLTDKGIGKHNQAVTTPDGKVIVSSNATGPAEQIADHEEVHATQRLNKDAFVEYQSVVCENIMFNRDAFLKEAQDLNEKHSIVEIRPEDKIEEKLSDIEVLPKILNELIAYMRQCYNFDADMARERYGDIFESWDEVAAAIEKFNKDTGEATSDEGASFLPENAEESGSAFEEPSAAFPEYDLVKDTGAQLAGVKRYSDGQRQIMEIGRKLGYRVVFDPNLTNASGVFANGKIDRKNKVIYINPKSKRVKQWILKHELVHFGKRSDAYNQYAEIVKKSDLFYDWLKSRGANGDNAIIMLADLKQKKMDAYAEAGEPIGPAKAEEEILGDFSGDVVFSNDERGMQRFLESLDIRERNAVVQFILDFVSYLKEKFSGNKQMTVELARLERRYSKMIHEAKETTAENGDGVSYSIAGQKARTANYFKLDEAIKMEEIGKATSEEIRQKTGWFRGYDRKWRYEISDRDIEVDTTGKFHSNPDIRRQTELFNKVYFDGTATESEIKELQTLNKNLKGVSAAPKKLGQLIKHDKLFEAYPFLKNVNIRFEFISDLGAYNPVFNEIVLSNNIKLNKEKLIKTLLHEIQHAIQHYEGFARGSNIQYWRDLGIDEKELFKYYENTAGEIEARDTANRWWRSDEARKEKRPDIDRTDVVFSDSSNGWSSAKYDPETSSISEQIKNSQSLLNQMDVVGEATVPQNLKTKYEAAQWAISQLKPFGYQVDRQNFGKIYFEEKDIRNGAEYADTSAERAAFVLIPKILKRGIEIGHHGDHKKRHKETITFAAPVILNGIRGNMAVVVNLNGNRYLVHRILLPDGTTFKFSQNNKEVKQETYQGVTKNSSLADTTSFTSNNKLTQNEPIVNTNSMQGNEDYSLAVEKDVKYSISPDSKTKRKNEPYQPVENYAPQTKDADGHKLSQGILDYFKYSMVRDSKGRLIPVYHGSKNAGFTRFAKSDDIGYFFARTLKTAQTYSGTKKIYAPDKNSAEFSGAANYKTFLNLKNPYIIDGNGLYWNNLESYGYDPVTVEIKSSYWNEDGTGKATLILEYKGKTYKQTAHNSTEFENFLAEHLNREMAVAFAHAVDAKFDENGKGHFATQIPWDFSASKQGKSKNTRDIVRRAEGWNYDGVIFRNVIDSGDGSKIGADDLYVAFYPNQIKSVNNTEPTSNPDIRYSLDVGEETRNNAIDLSNDNELSQRVEGLHGAERYKKIQSYILEVLADQPLTLSDGKKAVVDKSDALHIANNAADKKTAQISKLKELIETATLYAEDNNVEHNKFDYFCYYKADVKYDEDIFPIYLNVGKGKNDGKYHIYDITNKIRDTADRINGLERPKPNEGYALTNGISTDIITDEDYSVNTNSMQETVDYTERMNVLDDDFKSGTITREEYFEKINALYKEAGEKNGTVKQGESVSGKENFDNPLPQSVKDKTKVRTHVRTIIEGGELTEEMIGDIKHRVLKGEFSYVPTSNEKNQDAAKKYIESGSGKALWDNVINGKEKPSAVGIAVGEALLKGAIENGEAADVVKYTAELAELGTRLGQSVQALSLLKRMDGIGQLYYVQKTVNTLNKDLSKRFGADAPLVTLNETLARQLAQSKTEEDFETAYSAIMDHIASQVPSTFLDKWNAWRYMAMLANPTTHIRNVAGNAVFVPAIKIKDAIAVGMEQFLPQDERTKSVVVKKEYKEFAEKDFEYVAEVILGSGKMNPSRGIADNRAIFKNKVLEGARKFNFDMLEKEDLIFLKMHYKRALGGYLQAQGVNLKNVSNKVLQQAREYAILEAQKATYRDASALATALSDLLQKNAVANVLVEGILPFKKTPINIVKRGIEYSPVGLIKTLTQGTYQLKRGEITASQYIDGLAAGLTGTGLVALGMGLASLGFVRGGFDDDDEDQFNKLMGMQEYSVEIGGFSYTIDWMAPSSIPFFIGVTVMENMMAEDNSTTFSMISNSLLSGMEPIINLSMLSGIEDTIASARYADANEIVSSIAGKIIGSYFSQALPTIGARLANMVDPVRRTNYIDKTSHVPKFVQSAINTIEGKVPFASKLKAKYINAWGEKEYKGGVVERFFQNFLSPGYLSDVEIDNISEEIMRLAKSLGDKSVYPDTAPKKVQFKNMTKYLDRKEYEKYAIEKGQMSADYVKEAVESKAYSKLEDYQKAWLINKLYEFADAKAKTNISYSYDELNAMFDGAMTKEQYERFNAKARKTLAEDYFLNKKGYKTAFKKERNGASVVDYYIKQAAKVEE